MQVQLIYLMIYWSFYALLLLCLCSYVLVLFQLTSLVQKSSIRITCYTVLIQICKLNICHSFIPCRLLSKNIFVALYKWYVICVCFDLSWMKSAWNVTREFSYFPIILLVPVVIKMSHKISIIINIYLLMEKFKEFLYNFNHNIFINL